MLNWSKIVQYHDNVGIRGPRGLSESVHYEITYRYAVDT